MTVSVICLTSNRYKFLHDFLNSFQDNAREGTELVLCAQGCTDKTLFEIFNLKEGVNKHNIRVLWERSNEGLNRYDQLVANCSGDLLVDVDDDSILFPGFEEIFEAVLADERFGWVGFPVKGTQVQPFPNGREWNINCYRVVEAPVGGGLAATRKSVWEKIEGFGQGKTLFDPEDARYQRKCQANGYLTGVIVGKLGIRNTFEVYVEKELNYIHNGDWEHHIKYGTALQKLESLRQAMLADFIDEATFRRFWQQYLEAMEKA